ncbi:hypothetical protein MBS37_16825 [Klebsiella pneumoniae]|nr:hypothetical protein MBS37_16825 [Klebsiella pneumoniae]
MALHSGSAGRGGAPPQHHGDRCGGEHQRPLAGLCAHGGRIRWAIRGEHRLSTTTAGL